MQSLNSLDAASYRLAQKLAAAEKKIILDAEFAKRLQAAINSGEVDTDVPEMQNADRVFGSEVVSSKVAGKRKASATIPSAYTTVFGTVPPIPALLKKHDVLSGSKGKSKQEDKSLSKHLKPNPCPTCDICFEPFQVTHSPISAALTANSSTKLPFGLRLPCPGKHPYCISCLTEYINGKIDPSGNGEMNTHILVFPIPCPGCPIAQWGSGIQDEVAEKVLDRESLGVWYHRKLLDSLPRQFCPNPKCSVFVQIDEDNDDPRAQCPACFEWVCVYCKAMWHKDMSCEEYQSLPVDERSPEDQLAIELAKAKQWRRCPGCHAIVELTFGCNHITCICKKEFCFKCGSLWDTRRRRCTSNPPCELWQDETMLLDIREREREAQANRLAQAGARPGPAERANAPAPLYRQIAEFFGRPFGLFQPAVPEPARPESPPLEVPRPQPVRLELHRPEPPRLQPPRPRPAPPEQPRLQLHRLELPHLQPPRPQPLPIEPPRPQSPRLEQPRLQPPRPEQPRLPPPRPEPHPLQLPPLEQPRLEPSRLQSPRPEPPRLPPRPEPPRLQPPPLEQLRLGQPRLQPRPEPLRPEQPRLEHPRPVARSNDGGDFEWISNPTVASLNHPFTREMILNLTCGYCNNQLNSINDLRYHLTRVRYHSVFSCCGKIFKREIDLDRHRMAKKIHTNEVMRNTNTWW